MSGQSLSNQNRPIGPGNEASLSVVETSGCGLSSIKFHDDCDRSCSIEESPRVVCQNEDGTVDNPRGWIWLGLDDSKPQIMKSKAYPLGMEIPLGEISGWMPYPIPEGVFIPTKMHLNEKQVRGLVSALTRWLDSGTLADNQDARGISSTNTKESETL